MRLRFATRPSALARRQTARVMDALRKIHPDLTCEETVITTRGDRIMDRPLPEIGGKGLFTGELEAELQSGAVDCAVHSLKDLPVQDSPGLAIGSIPARADARDVLISATRNSLETLPYGSSVGTSSLRRAAQLLALRRDLQIRSIRGNVDTRVRKLTDGEYDAIVLAAAGLARLGLDHHATEWLPLDVMLPAPGQGALAVQCRADDGATLSLLAGLNDPTTAAAVTAERAFLSALGGGCAVPVAAYASADRVPGGLTMTGLVISEDGFTSIRVAGEGTDPSELGARLARQAVETGANEILSGAAHKAGGEK